MASKYLFIVHPDFEGERVQINRSAFPRYKREGWQIEKPAKAKSANKSK